MQSALEDVKGVKEADVSVDTKEAIAKFHPDVAKVDDLIKAVKEASGPHGPYDAKIRKK